MVTIGNSTIRNNVYETVYDLINSERVNFGSPALFGGYPDEKDFVFPCIIVYPIIVGEDSYTVDSSRSVSNKNVSVQVEIYSEKNKDLDIVSDGVTHVFRSNQMSGLMLNDVTEDNAVIFPNDSKLKMKTLMFTFLRR